MDKTIHFYETMQWDWTIRNNDNTINELKHDLFSLLQTNVENFDHYLIDSASSPASSQDSDIPASSLSRKRTTADISSLSPRDTKREGLSPLSSSPSQTLDYIPFSAKRLATIASKSI